MYRCCDAFNMPPTATIMMSPIRAWVKVFQDYNPEFSISIESQSQNEKVSLKMLNLGDNNSFSD